MFNLKMGLPLEDISKWKGVFNMSAMLEVTHKQSVIRAAKDLCYGEDVIDKLKKAVSDNEITRIMFSDRNINWLKEGRRN